VTGDKDKIRRQQVPVTALYGELSKGLIWLNFGSAIVLIVLIATGAPLKVIGLDIVIIVFSWIYHAVFKGRDLDLRSEHLFDSRGPEVERAGPRVMSDFQEDEKQ
jgi:hypothetical protein